MVLYRQPHKPNALQFETDGKFFGGVSASFRVMSPIDCLRTCLNSRQACDSVNFGPVFMGGKHVPCELVKTGQDSLTNITEAPGWSLVVGE